MREDIVTDEETNYSSTSSGGETGSTTLDDAAQPLTRSANRNHLYHRWNSEISRIKNRLDRQLFSVVKRTQNRVDSVFACQQHVLLESSEEDGCSSEGHEATEKRILFMNRRKMQRLKEAAARNCPIEVSDSKCSDRRGHAIMKNTVAALSTPKAGSRQQGHTGTFLQFDPQAKGNIMVASPRSVRSDTRSASDKTLRSTSDRTAHLSNLTKHVEERRQQQLAVNFEIIEEQDDVSDSYPLDVATTVFRGQVVPSMDTAALNHPIMVKQRIKAKDARSEPGSVGSKRPPYPELTSKEVQSVKLDNRNVERRHSPVVMTQLSEDESGSSSSQLSRRQLTRNTYSEAKESESRQEAMMSAMVLSPKATPSRSIFKSPCDQPPPENDIKTKLSIDLSLHETPSLTVSRQQSGLVLVESVSFPPLLVKRTTTEDLSSSTTDILPHVAVNPMIIYKKVPDPDGVVFFAQSVQKQCPRSSSDGSKTDLPGSLVGSSVASASSQPCIPLEDLTPLDGDNSGVIQVESLESTSHNGVRSRVLKEDNKDSDQLVTPKAGHRSPLLGLPEQHSHQMLKTKQGAARNKLPSSTNALQGGRPDDVTGSHEECGESLETAEVCLNDIEECKSDLTWFSGDRPLSAILVKRPETGPHDKSIAAHLHSFSSVTFPDDKGKKIPINCVDAEIHEKPTAPLTSDLRYVTRIPLIDPKGDHGIYTGILIRETPFSFGEMNYTTNGKIYKGTWENGTWHGNGQVVFPNGDTYTGQFVNDVRHGTGRYCWADGRIYDGGFVNNQREGVGTYYWPDRSVYAGGFRNGVRHGDGTVVGEWVNGSQEGTGECVWHDGRYYKGEWKKGQVHGRGIEVRSDGTIRHDGEWKCGRPVRVRTAPAHDGSAKTISGTSKTEISI